MDAYLLDLEVDELPGVGWNMCHKLKDLGIASVRHVRGSSKDVLQRELGSKTGAFTKTKLSLCNRTTTALCYDKHRQCDPSAA